MLVRQTLLLITDLGNLVVVGAVAATVAAYLVMAGCRRPALALLAAFGLAMSAAAAAKLICMSCRVAPLDAALRSPSGHVAMSMAVYCMVAAILSARLKRYRFLIWSATLALIGLIAVSRVALGYHTSQEVIAGFLIGGACFALVRWLALRDAEVRFNGWALAITVAAVIVIFHNVPFQIEHLIQMVALYLRPHIRVC